MDVTVEADFFQYYLSDSHGGADLSQADFTDDGVIAPVGTAIRINTRIQYGPVSVSLDFRDSEPGTPAEETVAAEADMLVPSGTVELLSQTLLRVASHSYDEACLVRVRVEWLGDGSQQAHDPQVERHKITVWPVNEAAPRWQSQRLPT